MQQDKGFKVGDIVKFKIESLYIKDYYTSALDKCNQKYIKHGSLTIKENKGTIKYIDTNYFYIEYIDEKDKKVCLGFKSDSFELLEPKQEQYYTSIPTDVKEGDRFVVVSNIRLEGDVYNFPFYGIDIGSIVTLSEYHKSRFSKFTNEQGEIWEYNWGWLKPVKVVTNSHLVDVSPTVLFGRDSLGNDDVQQFEVGDEVEIIEVICYSDLTVGMRGFIKHIPNDGRGYIDVMINGSRYNIFNKRLKLINKTNHNYGKVQNSMSFSTTSYKITRGETICSSAIRCSKSKIQI